MDIAPMLIFTLFTMACAAYAHYRMPWHSTTTRQLWVSHLVLVLVGTGFGWAMLHFYGQTEAVSGQPLPRPLIFLSAFGLVHVPAAAILFLKRQRDKPRP